MKWLGLSLLWSNMCRNMVCRHVCFALEFTGDICGSLIIMYNICHWVFINPRKLGKFPSTSDLFLH